LNIVAGSPVGLSFFLFIYNKQIKSISGFRVKPGMTNWPVFWMDHLTYQQTHHHVKKTASQPGPYFNKSELLEFNLDGAVKVWQGAECVSSNASAL